jgi:hypothetical protein
MADFDINSTASTVFGIAGMGIGLGLLAHTAKNISHMTDDMYRQPTRTYTRPKKVVHQKKTYKRSYAYRPRRTSIVDPRPIYNWRL